MHFPPIDDLPIAAYAAVQDSRRSLRWVSSGAERLLGSSASLARQEGLDALVHPDDLPRVRSTVNSHREPGATYRCDYRVQAADGRMFWVRDEAVAVTDEDGSRVLHGVLLDVTDEHVTVQRLEESDARLRLLTELPAVVWTANERLELTSLAGRGLVDVAQGAGDFPGAEATAELKRALAGEDVCFSFRYGDRQFEASAQALPVEDGELAGVIGVAFDVTERRRAEAALVEQEARLREAQRLEALGHLAGGIAHDFGNLLAAIAGNAALILEDVSADHPLRGEAESILRTADRAEALVDQLFAFARSGEVHAEDVDVNRIVEGLLDDLEHFLPSRIRLVLELEQGIEKARVDPSRLEQVIVNLVVNARDAMRDGGTLRVRTGQEGATLDGVERRYVVVAVSDTGTGIDEETRSRMFEPFFTRTARAEATGLGLAIVQRIVEQSQGRIVVDSVPGRGSTFRVFLPASGQPVPSASPARR